MNDAMLRQSLVRHLLEYGRSQEDFQIAPIKGLYGTVVRRFSVAERLRLEQGVAESIEQGRGGALSLLPILVSDPNHQVVSTSALDLAVYTPLDDGDPLTGPKTLLGIYDRFADDPQVRLGILSGLLAYGDERLLPLVKGKWSDFSAEDRRLLALTTTGFSNTLEVEFLVDWLEHTSDEGDVGTIAGALCRMPRDSRDGHVLKLQRLPITQTPDGSGVRVLQQFTFHDYAGQLAPRLMAVSASESEPKVVPKILDMWGASPQP